MYERIKFIFESYQGTFERLLVFFFSLTELFEIGFCGTSEKI
jgi:hypothetical protein